VQHCLHLERSEARLGKLADAGAVRLERGRIEVTNLAPLRRHGGLLA
jgi:hypothetical protein